MESHRIQSRSLLKSLLFERLRWRILMLLLSLLATIFGLLAPYCQKEFTDALFAGQQTPQWIVYAFFCLLLQQGFYQLSFYTASREGLISQKAIGDAAYQRLLEGPGGLIGRSPAGQAVSLFAVDIPGAAAILDQAMLMAFAMIFPLILSPIALHSFFGIPWWASFGSITLLAFVNIFLAKRQSRFFFIFKQMAAERTGLVSEWVQNIRTLRILGWMAAAEARIFSLRRRETVNRKKMVTNGQLMNSIATSATFGLNVLAVLLLLHLRNNEGGQAEPTPGELLSLLWILGVFLARPLRQLPWVLVMSLDSLSSVRRLEAALAIPIARPQLIQPTGASREGPTPITTALDIRNLSLEVDGKLLLQDIDLRLNPGTLTAIVGEVGSGKSLLLQSLIGGAGARFSRFAVFGEETTGPLDPKVRGKFAFVPQEGFTISASLRENVLFTYLDEKKAELGRDKNVIQSLKLAQFDPEKERVTDGLDSEIGERGVNLSGGQRQRIGLARAHFTQRDFYLLDDCLSAVDVDTEEHLINELLIGDWSKRTRLIATHRLSILPRCNEILFLNGGKVQARGTYEELLARSLEFREFVRREVDTSILTGDRI